MKNCVADLTVADSVEGLEEDDAAADMEMNLHVRTPFLDEKASACHAIGVFAENVGATFVPYP